ncbi:HCLS1-associated protein X-1 isoform X1 [Poeciliopsis prolifica]|uniref:HCLS1-associated protein X-1 isoform X1 n=2 Tax=Poeciliopsis prolifica TaxID=188132 RepID=UPI0024138943|nr:HCLS1-associated protein X-1 isoform X1 [Poeciliopsis prolifica]
MSVFDLFRGFFGVPGGHFRGRRDPFFDAMTHDDDDEDDEEEGFYYDGFRWDQQDPLDRAWRFGFNLGPDGMRFQEPAVFGHVLREMEEIFSQLGRWEGHPESGHFGVPRILPPSPPQGRSESSGNPLRDFMLKSPDGTDRRPHPERRPSLESSPFDGWSPFSKFNDFWGEAPQRTPGQEAKEDSDLDSAVSSGGLDQILTPPVGQEPSGPQSRSFFQSVVVTKVVKPDGTVEEQRTVRDGHGNQKTTVSRSGGPDRLDGPDRQPGPVLPGDSNRFSDLRDDDSLFSQFFGGFK